MLSNDNLKLTEKSNKSHVLTMILTVGGRNLIFHIISL